MLMRAENRQRNKGCHPVATVQPFQSTTSGTSFTTAIYNSKRMLLQISIPSVAPERMLETPSQRIAAHHVVSYYKLMDAVESYSEEAGVLKSLERPSQDPKFKASQFSPRIVGLCEKTTVFTQSCA